MQTERAGLGPLLKAWRERLSPADVGLPSGGNRRAVGLRREELAALAGLSVDYVVRLEQGRATNPSEQVVASLARALQLGDLEREHLYVLAHLLPPSPGRVSRHIPAGVQRLVARLGETPIAVFTASWDLVTWSPLWAALLGDPSGLAERDRNLLRMRFSGRMMGNPVRSGRDPKLFESALVSDLRCIAARYPDDPGVRSLIADLLETSEGFAALWRGGAVGEHVSERKTVENPLVGEVELDCDVFTVPGADLRIVAYTVAAGTPEAEKLDFLRVSALAALRS
ncbi:helix-turn-helix transcriptional regulator [Frondihabitans australicus]|uniref:Helix-turn-helix protein n=1 Tax=Frondihabitans australicus TaxID=386892 RepID=A0A495IAD9_9MICO|nr:helix-turn-helix transcriptional regulator [Frondihabitans australicus]RKR72977.1 helix-turn-helix protein [Frondihabitans australicus]